MSELRDVCERGCRIEIFHLLNKARQQPDKVRMVLDKARTDGVAALRDGARSKLDQPLALGYCNVGVVADLGAGVEGFAVGDHPVPDGKHSEVKAGGVFPCKTPHKTHYTCQKSATARSEA